MLLLSYTLEVRFDTLQAKTYHKIISNKIYRFASNYFQGLLLMSYKTRYV